MASDAIIANHAQPATHENMPATIKIPGNKDCWLYVKDWHYISKDGLVIRVPKGFVTDLDSIPRIPIIYAIFKGRTVAGVGAHDWLYRKNSGVSRSKADDLMKEIAKWEGTRNRYVKPMHLAVRLFGGSRYQKKPSYNANLNINIKP